MTRLLLLSAAIGGIVLNLASHSNAVEPTTPDVEFARVGDQPLLLELYNDSTLERVARFLAETSPASTDR